MPGLHLNRKPYAGGYKNRTFGPNNWDCRLRFLRHRRVCDKAFETKAVGVLCAYRNRQSLPLTLRSFKSAPPATAAPRRVITSRCTELPFSLGPPKIATSGVHSRIFAGCPLNALASTGGGGIAVGARQAPVSRGQSVCESTRWTPKGRRSDARPHRRP